LGGLARRAAFFEKIRSEKSSAFFIRGPFEYTRPEKDAELNSTRSRVLDLIYPRLNYDLSFPLSPEYSPPDKQKCDVFPFSSRRVKVATADIDRGKAGFVLLPREMDNQAHSRVQKAIEDFRRSPEIVLVLAVSGLGAVEENKLFSEYDFSPDILLGGGPGAGMRGRIKNRGKTLWIRPYSRGKSVSFIRVFSLPGEDGFKKWVKNKNVEFGVIPLRGDIPLDRDIQKIISEKW
jgi:hypothetical protein